MILTIRTLKVAVGEKNIADAFSAANGRLFTTVYTNRPDGILSSAFAIPCVSCQPVHSAVSGTEMTIFKC
jgi:hypothetical protein